MGPVAMILVFWMLSFKPTFSLSSFTFNRRLFSSSSLSAIKVVSSAYLRLLIFLPAIFFFLFSLFLEANYNIWWFFPYIHMNQPWVYMRSPSWPSLPPPSSSHLSGSSQCTSPEHPVSCIEPGLAICFTYDNIHVSMLFSQIIPPSPSPTESKRLFYTSVSLLLSHIQGYHYHLSKFHIYALVYCIGVFLSGLLHSV